MTKWTYDAEQKAGRLEMDGALTIARVDAIRESLLQGLAAAEQLVCELSGVKEVDVAGMQLLCAACHHAEAHGKTLLLAGIPSCISSLAHQAGFDRSMPCLVGQDASGTLRKMA